MQLADVLSHCPASQEIKLDMRVDYIAFTKPWIEKLKDSTQRDPILVTMYQLTQQGWLHQRRHVPCLARRYWDFGDELSTDDGMLLKGLRLIIPGELQEEYLSHLHKGHLSQMDNLRDQQQRIAVLKHVAMQPQNQPRPVSVPPAANVPLPPYPRRRPSDMGSRKQVQAENANALCKSSDSETDRLQDIHEEPHRCIGPSRVKELAKFFTPTSDEEDHS